VELGRLRPDYPRLAQVRVVAQRVDSGSVRWEGSSATIGHGFVLLVGAAGDDDESTVRRLADKIIDLRVFADEAGRMNLSLVDVRGAALIVSQFTLFADMSKGRRPSLLKAGDPARAEQMYEVFVDQFRRRGIETQTGSFGAVMRVEIANDGPVTLVLSTDEWVTRV
jgi:D-tyrosyl-tRNA(Tyr) deacylase